MRERGFSLIELLIVVAVILVISAIAIPRLLHAKMAANESSAVASIRTINSAQSAYVVTYPAAGFSDTLTKLGPSSAPSSTSAGLLDSVLGCAAQPCAKSGYQFSIANATGSPVTSFNVYATPQGSTQGRRGFCSDTTALPKADPNGGTNCTDLLN